MRLFLSYIKQRRRLIYAALLFCAVFIFSFFLYRLPVEAVLYPVLLCVLFSALFTVFDFTRVYKRHMCLCRIEKVSIQLLDELPAGDGICDNDYRQLITLLMDEHTRLETLMSTRYSDMIDYYTAWAHQIKTPIASMRLNLQNEDSQLSRRLSSDLFRIEQYVSMVMTFLRLDSEYTDYVIEKHSLDDIICQAVRNFRGEFIERRLRLVYEPLDISVITDEKWLCFVIEQVLSNALKYTEAGSITISLEAPQTLCISDTGIGIASEDLPRIFDKGYTGYNGRDDKKASGIGLYLCRRICTNLNHTISANSVQGEGTVVRINLSQRKLVTE